MVIFDYGLLIKKAYFPFKMTHNIIFNVEMVKKSFVILNSYPSKQ